MFEQDLKEPTAAELAESVALLPEWDRLAVRDYWAELIAEELGTRVPLSARSKRPTTGSRERVRLHRSERRKEHTVLRLVTQAADTAATPAISPGTAA